MKKKLFIHVGYPKTATTTLQKSFYPEISEISYLGLYENKGEVLETTELTRLGNNNLSVLLYSDIKSSEFMSLINSVQSKFEKDSCFLLSDEDFLCLSLKKTFRQKKASYLPSPLELAERIRQVFREEEFDVNIIVSVRKQEQMITSLYAQSYVHYYSMDEEVNTFNKFFHVFTDKNTAHPFKEALNYNKVLSDYETVFGRENLNVIVYEELVKDPVAFYSSLCDVLDVPKEKYSQIALGNKENVRATIQNYKQAKKLSLFDVLVRVKAKYLGFVSFSFIPRGFLKWMKNVTVNSNEEVSKTIMLDENQVELVRSVYAESNKKLAERYCLNLKEYGYFD